ncbi:MAG: O-antigen ligase family protein [Xanthomonadales bacterium]|nr:O-antigen ligase family protein [Xanthomonadales bacterium]
MTHSPSRSPFLCLLALVFVLPIPLGANRPWAWLTLAAVTFGLLAWTVALPTSRATREVLLRTRSVLWVWVAWLLFGLFQLIPLPMADGWHSWSVDPYASSLRWLQSLWLAALFYLVLRLANHRHRIRQLAYCMVLAGVLQALYGSLMTLSNTEWLLVSPKEFGVGLATGTFVNRNHYAGFLEITLGIGVGLLLSQIRSNGGGGTVLSRVRGVIQWVLGPKMRLRLSLVIMVVALVLSHSRMGNTAFFLSLLVAGVLALILLSKAPKPLIVLIASLIAIDVLVVGTWFGVEQVVDRIQQTATYDEAAARYQDSQRLDVDAETLRAWADYRWLGSGGGTFAVVFPAYRPQDLSAFFDHAHNDYLEFLLEYGIVGALPLAMILVSSLAAALYTQRRRRDPLMRGMAFGCTMVIVAYLVHSLVDFNLQIPSNAAYFVICLSLCWLSAFHRSPVKT